VRWRAAVAAVLLTAVTACGGGDDAVPGGPLRIATGQVGGVYHAYGGGIRTAVNAELPQLRVEVLATDASAENLRLLDARRTELAFTLADTAADAVEGTGPFTDPIDMVALARLYDNYVQLVVPAASPVRTLADLRGALVSTGAAGSGTDLVADRLFEVAELRQVAAPAPGGALRRNSDVRTVNLGIEESAAGLRAGTLDAFFFFGGIPTPAVAELARAEPVRVLPLGEWVPKLAARFGGLYTEAVIPASPYGLDAPVRTVSVPNYLVARRDMDAELAYRLTRLLFTRTADLARAHPEGRRLSARTAISTYPLDLHPGAERWYRQARR
jgi:TRAP transporter TAXI family solute receptor